MEDLGEEGGGLLFKGGGCPDEVEDLLEEGGDGDVVQGERRGGEGAEEGEDGGAVGGGGEGEEEEGEVVELGERGEDARVGGVGDVEKGEFLGFNFDELLQCGV